MTCAETSYGENPHIIVPDLVLGDEAPLHEREDYAFPHHALEAQAETKAAREVVARLARLVEQ